MKKIKFESNFNNKLKCDCFTSIRLYEAGKFKNGEILQVLLNGVPMKTVEVIGMKLIRLIEIDEHIAFTDMGVSTEELQTYLFTKYNRKVMNWANANFVLLLLKYVPNITTGSTSLFDDEEVNNG